MVTWFDGSRLAAFPLVWFFFFFLPGAMPALPLSDAGSINLPLSLESLSYPREWVMNHLVLPILPIDWAIRLADWWMSTGYWGEVALHALVSMHVFLPVAVLMFVWFELSMTLQNWWTRKQYRAESAQAKKV